MTARDELVTAIVGRYSQADRMERGRILDEFTAVTGFHRKHAMRLLRAGQPNRRSGPRPGRRVYDDAAREALIVIWEASDRIAASGCGRWCRFWSRRWSATAISSSRRRFASAYWR
jgi:hypothetical protein